MSCLEPHHSETGLTSSQEKGAPVTMADFHLLQHLGSGGFGMVLLAQHKRTLEYRAIKVMDKRMILAQDGVTSVYRERQVLASIEHPFIVSLRHALQTSDHVCFVLDFADCGNMYADLKHGAYSEARTQFHASQIVLAIEHLHSLDILYRDLKPDNVLLLSNGDIQLADMGAARGQHSTGSIAVRSSPRASAKTAREGSRKMTITGTHGYRAPEVYSRVYGKPADWWCVGILIIEMLSGSNPLRGEDRRRSEELACYAVPVFPPGFCPAAATTVLAFIEKDWSRRLGTPRNNETEACAVNKIKSHDFFADVDFNQLLAGQVKPPFELDMRMVRPTGRIRPRSLETWCSNANIMQQSGANRPPLNASEQSLFEDFDFGTGNSDSVRLDLNDSLDDGGDELENPSTKSRVGWLRGE